MASAVFARQPEQEVRLFGRLCKPKGRNFVAFLRGGYFIESGDDVIPGPAEVTMTPQMLVKELHKIDNREQAIEFLGLPPEEPIPSPEAIIAKVREEREAAERRKAEILAEALAQRLVPVLSNAFSMATVEIVRAMREGEKSKGRKEQPSTE